MASVVAPEGEVCDGCVEEIDVVVEKRIVNGDRHWLEHSVHYQSLDLASDCS